MQYSPDILERMQIVMGGSSTGQKEEPKPKEETKEDYSGITGSIRSGVDSVINFFTNSILRLSIIVVGLILLYLGLRSYLPTNIGL